jgi:hypothetical protein
MAPPRTGGRPLSVDVIARQAAFVASLTGMGATRGAIALQGGIALGSGHEVAPFRQRAISGTITLASESFGPYTA